MPKQEKKIQRLMREMREGEQKKAPRAKRAGQTGTKGLPGSRPASPVPSAALPPSPPESEDENDLDVEALDPSDPELVRKWIAKVERQATKAETDGNIGAFASLTAKLISLIEHARKAQPLPKPDPNDNPDFIAMKEHVRAEFHKRIKLALEQ
jgi:hypothetical protein